MRRTAVSIEWLRWRVCNNKIPKGSLEGGGGRGWRGLEAEKMGAWTHARPVVPISAVLGDDSKIGKFKRELQLRDAMNFLCSDCGEFGHKPSWCHWHCPVVSIEAFKRSACRRSRYGGFSDFGLRIRIVGVVIHVMANLQESAPYGIA